MPSRVLFSLAALWSAALLGCSGNVIVPGSHEDTRHNPPAEPGPRPPAEEVGCRVRLVPDFGSGTVKISEDGLSASSVNTFDIVRGSASHAGGRWYFEVRIDSMPGGTWWAQNIGIGTIDAINYGMGPSAGMGVFLNGSGSLSEPNPEVQFSGKPYGAGDVIGVAADLDAGLVFFSKNGEWMNGADPSSGAGGVEVLVLPGTGSYYPAIGLSEGDAVTASFGQKAFASAPPAGYEAFNAGLDAASGECVDPGPEGIPAPPAPMEASCTSEDFSSYGADVSGAPELHVIGIYEPSVPGGVVSVHVARQGDIVLALSTYNAANFQVTADPGVNISRIVLSSYELSSVSAPAGIPVDTFIVEQGEQWLGSGYAWPAATGGSDTQALIKAVESISGRELTSFGGCYSGSAFTLTD